MKRTRSVFVLASTLSFGSVAPAAAFDGELLTRTEFEKRAQRAEEIAERARRVQAHQADQADMETLPHGQHWQRQAPSSGGVPELDPTAAGGALALLAGGALVLLGRRKRHVAA